MAPPTTLVRNTDVVLRLTNEEVHYRKELVLEKNRLAKMEVDGVSDTYAIDQQNKVIEETKAAFPTVRKHLLVAIGVLKGQIDAATDDDEPEANKEKARKAVEDGQKILAAAADDEPEANKEEARKAVEDGQKTLSAEV